MTYSLIIFSLLSVFSSQPVEETIYFKSKDGIQVSADLYMAHDESAPFIVLFHQAGWSRGEYVEIAPDLNALGYNCMAVDLRSGGSVNDIKNITNQNAIKGMKETKYVNAIQDMEAAIEYARSNFATGKLIIWGSSYSSALSLKLAGDMSDKIDGVLAFSPGEYFASQGKPRDFVTSGASKISDPVFITSARSEKNTWWGIYVAISSEKEYFLPKTAGNHGSRALWEKFSDSKEYWDAVKKFLKSIE